MRESVMSFQIVDAKKHRLDNKSVRALAEIVTHPKVMELDVDIHTPDPNEMNTLFKKFFERLPDDPRQWFLVGKLDEVIGFSGGFIARANGWHILVL